LNLPSDSSVTEIIDEARCIGTGNSDIFGLRIQRHSFDFWMAQLAILHPSQPSDLGRIEATFGPTAFIHLTRADKVGQAVSLVRAAQSGLWHRNADGSEMERLALPQDLRYDHAAIAQELTELTTSEQAWAIWFSQANITPLKVHYEALVSNPTATIRHIFDHLGLDQTQVKTVVPPTAKLADEVNLQWAQRFVAETS
jgi:LPS sulfotransferase NodH